MKKNILIIVCILGTFLIGYIVGMITRSPVKQESFSYLQAQAYRQVWSKCKIDTGSESKCKTLMIHDVQPTSDGESSIPSGYVFVFSNAYDKSNITLAYSVRTISVGSQAGRIYPAVPVVVGDINDIPE